MPTTNIRKSLNITCEIWEIIVFVFVIFRIKKLLRDYCTEAKKYGDVKVGINAQMKKVLVILNPAANKKQCEEDFNTYCAPVSLIYFNFHIISF